MNMGLIGDIKDAAKLVQQIGNMDLYKRILDLQAEAMELVETARAKDEEISELKKKLQVRGQIVYFTAAYYVKNDKGEVMTGEPFCQRCYDVEGLMCRLQMDGVYGLCHNCKSRFTLGERPFPRPTKAITDNGL
jgi:hypothetical protein